MPTPVFSSPYADAVAERGKFVALDMSDTASYPVTGMGKFAILVYDVAGSSFSSPSYTTQSLSSLPDKIASYQMSVNATLSSVTVSYPITFLEVYNRVASGSSTAYLLLSSSSQLNVTSLGIPISTNGFYSIDNVLISTISIATDGNSDLRIIGHYK